MCITCGLIFDAAADQHSHFKTDIHLTNLRRKLKGLSPLLTTAAPDDDDGAPCNEGVVHSLDVDGDAESDDCSDRAATTSGEDDELLDKLSSLHNSEEEEEQHHQQQHQQQHGINLQQCSSPRGIISKQTVPHLGTGLVVHSNRCSGWVFSFSFSLFSM